METTTSTVLSKLSPVQLDSLVDAIRSGECILVLGPYANLDPQGRAYRTLLANYLADKLSSTPMTAPERDSYGSVVGRLLLGGTNPGDIRSKIGDFYKQSPARPRVTPDVPYGKIIELGFRTIFNTDSDSRLMEAFRHQANLDISGLYFTLNPQPSLSCLYAPDEFTPETPIIINVFGLQDKPDSLVIGPEAEIQRLYALTSKEVSGMISQQIGDRFSTCRWYLFVGFNFNSWDLGSIFYFFNRLEKVREAPRVFGLHSKSTVNLADTTVVYFKNLVPPEIAKNDVMIDNLDAQTFFTELGQLAAPPPPARKRAFVVYYPTADDSMSGLLSTLGDFLSGHTYDVHYNVSANELDPDPSEEAIQAHIREDDLVVYIISPRWVNDKRYENYVTMAQGRTNNVQCIALSRPFRTIWQTVPPAFSDGITVLNLSKPLNLPTDDTTAILKNLTLSFS